MLPGASTRWGTNETDKRQMTVAMELRIASGEGHDLPALRTAGRSPQMAIQRRLIPGGIAARAGLVVALATLVISIASVQAADTLSGSGVVIGVHGEILTNAHVVENCTQITVRSSAGDLAAALLVARDEKNDLAVVRSKLPLPVVAAFRDGGPVRAGDVVVALGYPLSGLLATTANLSVGNVSALAGLGDDSRYLQISAPVQPGNSGGRCLTPPVASSGLLRRNLTQRSSLGSPETFRRM
jgi:S1-C subfamily serine protease